MTVLVRDPSKLWAKLEVKSERLHVVTGDALDPVVVDTAVRGQEAIICWPLESSRAHNHVFRRNPDFDSSHGYTRCRAIGMHYRRRGW